MTTNSEDIGNDDTDHASDKFVPPKDGSWVPRDRLNQALNSIEQLRLELDTTRNTQEEKPEPTREQLLEAVSNAEITQNEADQIWEASIVRRTEAVIDQKLAANNAETSQTAELKSYQDAMPELGDESSPEFLKVQKEYIYMLQDLRLPNNTGTMLAAMRATLGTVDNILASKKGRKKLDSHQDIGGGEGAVITGLKLTPKEKAYYERAILKGGYANWEAVKAEREFSR